MEEIARSVVDVLIPIVELIGALVIGIGVLVTFAAYVLSELRIRPRPYEGIRLLLGRFSALVILVRRLIGAGLCFGLRAVGQNTIRSIRA